MRNSVVKSASILYRFRSSTTIFYYLKEIVLKLTQIDVEISFPIAVIAKYS